MLNFTWILCESSRDEDEVRGRHEDERTLSLSTHPPIKKITKRIKTDTSDSSHELCFLFSVTNNGKLILGAESDEFLATQLAKMTARLEAEIRLEIYDQICSLDLVKDRKRLVKMGIENVALLVQDACAQIAIGETK